MLKMSPFYLTFGNAKCAKTEQDRTCNILQTAPHRGISIRFLHHSMYILNHTQPFMMLEENKAKCDRNQNDPQRNSGGHVYGC